MAKFLAPPVSGGELTMFACVLVRMHVYSGPLYALNILLFYKINDD